MEPTNVSNPVALKCPQCGANLSRGAEQGAICQYCGTSLIWNSRPAESSPVEKVVRGMRLKPLIYNEEQVTHMELFRMLAPAGWQFQGGCTWRMDNPGMPATVSFVVWNPKGAEGFEVLPNINFFWNGGAFMGSHYYGAEVHKPVSLEEAFRNYVIPRYRSRVENVQIQSITPLPDLPRLAKSDALITPGSSAEGGKARIRYTWQGFPFEEDIFGVVEVFRTNIGSMFGPVEVITWFIDYLFSFRAAAGRLDATADLFTVMIQSFKLNPQWYASFKTIAQQLVQRQIQHIRNIGQFGQMLAQAGSQMREQNLNDWYRRQSVFDRISVDQSRAIRDVDGFYDPHREEVVELPSGYGHAWANNLGEYILTEDSTFNPNLESNLSWEPMQQQSG